MLITKIKRKKGTTIIHWQDTRETDETTSKLESCDHPEPEFLDALDSLVSDVRHFLELPTTYTDGMSISGVSLSWGEAPNPGGCITALKEIEATTAPLVLNTPHVGEFDVTTLVHINELIRRAERFICGHRAQQELFDDPEGAEDELQKRLQKVTGQDVEVSISRIRGGIELDSENPDGVTF